MNVKTATLLIALCVFPSLSAVADTSADEIESKIKATGLKFRKTESGLFRLVFNEGDGRSQLVLVNGHSTSYRDVNFVEIWSKAVLSEIRPVNGSQMRDLLSGEYKHLGHWCLLKPSNPGGKWMLYYSIKIPVSATAVEFEAAIRNCSSVADKKEKELVGTDDN